MSTSDIKFEVCAMETCDAERTDGLSSDIGEFLSVSCMETDAKSEPFNSDSTLGFPEDSSRFDSECLLSSSLAEVPTQQTTCNSTVSSFIPADSLGHNPIKSIFTGGPLLMYSGLAQSTSTQKPVDPVMQFNSPSVVLLSSSNTDSKSSAGTDQKFGTLSPLQLLAPAVTHPRPCPVIIGNSSSALFVKNVLNNNASSHPSTSSSSNMATATEKEAVSNLQSGIMLLESPVHPQLNLLSSSPSASSAPALIYWPPSLVSYVQELLLNGCNSTAITSQNTLIDNASVSSTSAVSAESVGSECSTATISSAGSNLNSRPTVLPFAGTSIPLPLLPSVSSSSSSANLSVTPSCNTEREFSMKSPTCYSDNCSDSFASGVNSSDAVSVSTTQQQPTVHVPAAASQHFLISSVNPEKENKAMQQIIEHFLHENSKPSSSQITSENCEKLADSSHIEKADHGTSSDSDPCLTIQPQTISVADLNGNNDIPGIPIPSLDTKKSIVFILRRTASQQSELHQDHSSITSEAPLQKNSKELNTSDQDRDETDGSVAQFVNRAIQTSNIPASSFVSQLISSQPSEEPSDSSKQTEVYIPHVNVSLSSEVHSADSTPDSHPDTQDTSAFHWMHIKLPNPSAEEKNPDEGGENDDLQKLVPLTVNEKLVTDMCQYRPVILCIIQEDGVMKKININLTDTKNNKEKSDEGSPGQQLTRDDSNGGDNLEQKANSISPSAIAETKNTEPAPQVLHDLPTTSGPCHNTRQSKKASQKTEHEGCNTSAGSKHKASNSSSSVQSKHKANNSSSSAQSKASTAASKSKQFKCDLCTAVFTRLGNYTRHRKIHTLNLKEDKQYKCPYCDRPFLQRCDMNRHIAIHTKDFPFMCKTCGKGYIRKSDLVVHERFHSKDKAFKCETCGRCYYQSGDLSRHKRLAHSQLSQLSCGHCQRKYASEVTLIRHVKTAHNDILLQSMTQHMQQQ